VDAERDSDAFRETRAGVEQAWQMLELFASLGAHTFDLTQTDIDGHKQGFRRAVSCGVLRRDMPYLLDSAIHRQHNLIVRPHCAPVSWSNWTTSAGSYWSV
jgi:hypothetical protein